jgi:hypothetical protein
MKKTLLALAVIGLLTLAGCADFFAKPDTFSVSYDLNGGTGTAPSDTNSYEAGDMATVKAIPALTKAEHSLGVSWNTKADGTGISYSPAATFAVNADTVLYAQWTDLILGTWKQTTLNAYGGLADVAVTCTILADGTYSLSSELTYSAGGVAFMFSTYGLTVTLGSVIPVAVLTGLSMDTTANPITESGTYVRTKVGTGDFAAFDETGYYTRTITASSSPTAAAPTYAYKQVCYALIFSTATTANVTLTGWDGSAGLKPSFTYTRQ